MKFSSYSRDVISPVCTVDGTVYHHGDPIPTDDPCETCKCRPPGFSCVLRECEVKPGCKAIRREGECCPEYQCGCEHNGKLYIDGERIPNAESPCYSCYCKGSSILCALADCKFRFDCEPEYVAGECCPRYDHCPPEPSTTTVASSTLMSLFTTLPPRPTQSLVNLTTSPPLPITTVVSSTTEQQTVASVELASGIIATITQPSTLPEEPVETTLDAEVATTGAPVVAKDEPVTEVSDVVSTVAVDTTEPEVAKSETTTTAESLPTTPISTSVASDVEVINDEVSQDMITTPSESLIVPTTQFNEVTTINSAKQGNHVTTVSDESTETTTILAIVRDNEISEGSNEITDDSNDVTTQSTNDEAKWSTVTLTNEIYDTTTSPIPDSSLKAEHKEGDDDLLITTTFPPTTTELVNEVTTLPARRETIGDTINEINEDANLQEVTVTTTSMPIQVQTTESKEQLNSTVTTNDEVQTESSSISNAIGDEVTTSINEIPSIV
ncbi:hypothetical protein HDE_07109 [Halotydeus destructor]|nr:hypothetical protein HDE_07109 [Halotydeus destructor]